MNVQNHSKKAVIVEFTGPSGCGKTSLSKRLFQRLSRNYKTILIAEQAYGKEQWVPVHILNPERQNIYTDITIAPWSIKAILLWPKFILFCLISIVNSQEGLSTKASIVRSLWRKLGTRTFFQGSRFRDCIILVDEGVFHLSHNLLMNAHCTASRRTVQRFLDMVPMPDELIGPFFSEQLIQERLVLRGTWSSRAGPNRSQFVNNACMLFRHIYQEITDRSCVTLESENDPDFLRIVEKEIVNRMDV